MLMIRFCSSSLRGCFEVAEKEEWVKRQRLDRLSSYNSLVKKRRTPKGEADRLARLKQVCFEDGTPVWGAFNTTDRKVTPSKPVEGLLQWVEV